MWHITSAQACWKEWICLWQWISFGCMATMWVYLHISGEVFSWASVTCVSIWMGEEGTTRVRRFGRGGQAGARKQETAGNRRDCLSGAHPALCGLSKVPFLLALSKFSCTIPIKKLAQGYFFPFVEEDEELVSCFQQICFPFFFWTLKFCFQRADKMETEIIDSTTTSRPVKCHLCYLPGNIIYHR